VITGILASIGYALGLVAAWIWRAFADRGPRRPRKRSWPAYFIAGVVLLGVPHLMYREPDWIGQQPGQDVLESMFWVPFVTFWQITADLPFATGVPPGHGHVYKGEYVDAWNAVLRPADVTEPELARLRAAVAQAE
jgi:uncharacterized membrane protein